MAATDLSTDIATAAQGPASVTLDGQAMTAQPIAAQIEADRYLATKTGIKTRRRGLRFSKIITAGPLGTTCDRPGQGGIV